MPTTTATTISVSPKPTPRKPTTPKPKTPKPTDSEHTDSADNAAPSQTTPRSGSPEALRPGAFPPPPASVAQLLTVTQAATAITITVAERDIAAFDGQTGTGKTTAAAVATAEVGGVQWHYCVPPQGANTKQLMVAVYESIFGFAGPLTEREATSACAQRLIEGDLGLCVDEVHHVGVTGMQRLRHLWDQTATTRPFPMLLVGCNVRAALLATKEVSGRVARWVDFDFITHEDDLLTLTAELHPRLAATKSRHLVTINDDLVEGSIRAWHQLAKHIKYLSSSGGSDKPLTPKDIRELRSLMGLY